MSTPAATVDLNRECRFLDLIGRGEEVFNSIQDEHDSETGDATSHCKMPYRCVTESAIVVPLGTRSEDRSALFAMPRTQ